MGRWVINCVAANPRNGRRVAAVIGLIAIGGLMRAAVMPPYAQTDYLAATSGFWSINDSKSTATIVLGSGIAIFAAGLFMFAVRCQKLNSGSPQHTECDGNVCQLLLKRLM